MSPYHDVIAKAFHKKYMLQGTKSVSYVEWFN